MENTDSLMQLNQITEMIYVIRGERVMLDSDLAEIYGVSTKRLNEQVRRNIGRFPDDFMFQLNEKEFDNLRSQIATSSSWGGRRYPPYVFTEHGAVMLASVLNSEIAIHASIQVVRAFIHLRKLLISNDELARKLDKLEKKYDSQFSIVFEAIRKLMSDDESPQRKIGFRKCQDKINHHLIQP